MKTRMKTSSDSLDTTKTSGKKLFCNNVVGSFLMTKEKTSCIKLNVYDRKNTIKLSLTFKGSEVKIFCCPATVMGIKAKHRQMPATVS